uniref:Cerebellin 18 n=1 Tax=Paramormyrops kingsleyae TaxID=1676925 RepID=A0A3B3S8C2_9TELE
MYQSVFINLGESYNPATGIFTSPRSGVYNLAVTMYSDSGSAGALLAALGWHGELPCGKWACDCIFRRQTGCCCVANRFYQIEEETFKNLVEIWDSITHLSSDISTVVDGMRVAFTATMRPPLYPERCFGPFTRNVPIPYSIITLNDGNAYNPSLGTFTAQRAGLYSFAFTAYSDIVTAGLRLYHMVQLTKNGEAMTGVWEDNREDAEDSATQTVLLQLQPGDQVYEQSGTT